MQRNKENGYILLSFLMLMLMISVASLSVMDTGITEQKMAGNIQFQIMAFNTAESNLIQGEDFIKDTILTNFQTYKQDNGLSVDSFVLPTNANVTIEHLQESVVVETTEYYSGASPGCGYNETGCTNYYKVTSKGQGAGSATQTIESIFVKYITYVP